MENKQKKKLDIFSVLKQGTSFKSDTNGNLQNAFNKKRRKSSSEIVTSQIYQRKISISEFQKYNSSDSESEEMNQLETVGNKIRRKQSIDEIEKQLIRSQNQKLGRIQKIKKENRIKIECDQPPDPIENFTKMIKKYNIHQKIVKNLKEAGYKKPTPVQMQAIPVLMEVFYHKKQIFHQKRNLVCLAPTGTGKTLAFSLPILHFLGKHQQNGVRAIIFAPTFELAEQIDREISFLKYSKDIKQALRVKFIQKINLHLSAFVEQLKHIDILVCTPLKFLQIFKNKDELLNMDQIQFLILDEADKYFELVIFLYDKFLFQGMAKQVKQILEMFQQHTNITYALFSATIQHSVEDIMKNFLINPVKITINNKNSVIKNVDQQLIYCQSEFGKLYELKNCINTGKFTPPVLIFVQSKERGQELLEEMQKSFVNTYIKVDTINSDKPKHEREQIITNFRTGKLWALICTDLMARGIDFKGVKLVINYDFPLKAIDYIHRIGRTGRAQQKGTAHTYYTNEDRPLLKRLGNM